MSDVAELAQRIEAVERKLRSARAIATGSLALAVALGVGVAWRHTPTAPPPTRIELRTSDGSHVVTLDGSRITMTGSGGRELELTAEALALSSAAARVKLSAASLELGDPREAGATLSNDALLLTHGKQTIEARAAAADAHVYVRSDSMQRSVSIYANPGYAMVTAAFLPDDYVSAAHNASLASDQSGSQLELSRGDTTKVVDLPAK